MARRVVITIPDHGDLEEHADFVQHVADQLKEGFTSGHWTSERHWDVTEGTELDDQVRAAVEAELAKVDEEAEYGELGTSYNSGARRLARYIQAALSIPAD